MTYILEFKTNGTPEAMNKVLRMHWAKRDQYYKAWYQIVHFMTVGKRPETPLKKAKLSFVRYAYRKLDYDGCVASFKPVVDGLAHAKVLSHDGWSVTGKWDVDQGYAPKGQEYISVKVEGIE